MRWLKPFAFTGDPIKFSNTWLATLYCAGLISLLLQLGFSLKVIILCSILLVLHFGNLRKVRFSLRSQLIHCVLLLIEAVLLVVLHQGVEPSFTGLFIIYTASVALNNPAYISFPLATIGYCFFLFLDQPFTNPIFYISNVIEFLVYPFCVFIIRQLIHQRQHILELNQRIQSEAELTAEMTQLRERNRLAEAMHDTIGHTLTAAIVSLEGVALLLQKRPNEAIALLNSVREQLQAGLGDLRQTVRTLKTDTLAEHTTLKASLFQLVERMKRQTTVCIELHYLIQGELLPIQEYVLYSLVLEGMTNALKHSHATQIQIFFEAIDQCCIALKIIDNGEGTDSFEAGFGLTHLRQKVLALGGVLSIETQAQAGFRIQVLLPLVLDGSVRSQGSAQEQAKLYD